MKLATNRHALRCPVCERSVVRANLLADCARTQTLIFNNQEEKTKTMSEETTEPMTGVREREAFLGFERRRHEREFDARVEHELRSNPHAVLPDTPWKEN